MIHNRFGDKTYLPKNPQPKFEQRNGVTILAQKNNRIVVPEAKAAMEQFKMQAANEVGVNLSKGYNGDLTARQAGSIGGQMG